jgi:hypothetical protein
VELLRGKVTSAPKHHFMIVRIVIFQTLLIWGDLHAPAALASGLNWRLLALSAFELGSVYDFLWNRIDGSLPRSATDYYYYLLSYCKVRVHGNTTSTSHSPHCNRRSDNVVSQQCEAIKSESDCRWLWPGVVVTTQGYGGGGALLGTAFRSPGRVAFQYGWRVGMWWVPFV